MKEELLQKLIQEKCISPLDLLVSAKCTNGQHKVLPLFLSACYRLGHLYIECSKTISPDPAAIFPVLSEDEAECVRSALKHEWDDSLFEDLVRVDNRIYFERSFHDEQAVRYHIERLQKGADRCNNIAKLDLLLLQAASENILSSQQVAALKVLSRISLGILAGGPGTGKTHTAGVYLRLLLQSLPEAVRSRFQIALAGPTGKAVQNLKKSIERAYGGNLQFLEDRLHVKTLHALLQLSSTSRFLDQNEEGKFLPYHMIIVDEASMIDASLMRKFLSRVRKETQVIFLGDPNQLPPIEPGAIFTWMIENKIVPYAHLEECLRVDLKELVDFAMAVCDGKRETVWNYLQPGGSSAISFHHLEENKGLSFESYLEKFQEMRSGRLSDMSAFRILSPLRDGPFGVEGINRSFEHAVQLKQNRKGLYYPLIITKNDYDLQLMNGEMGLIDTKSGAARFFSDGKERSIPRVLLGPHESGYCLSVHKSQGSEFDHVLLILPPGSELFSKKMLYTAVTRARKRLEIYSTPKIIDTLLDSHRDGHVADHALSISR